MVSRPGQKALPILFYHSRGFLGFFVHPFFASVATFEENLFDT